MSSSFVYGVYHCLAKQTAYVGVIMQDYLLVTMSMSYSKLRDYKAVVPPLWLECSRWRIQFLPSMDAVHKQIAMNARVFYSKFMYSKNQLGEYLRATTLEEEELILQKYPKNALLRILHYGIIPKDQFDQWKFLIYY